MAEEATRDVRDSRGNLIGKEPVVTAGDVAKGTFGARARAADLAKAPNFRSKVGPKRADYPMTNAGGDQFNLDKAAYDAEQDRLAAQRAALSKP